MIQPRVFLIFISLALFVGATFSPRSIKGQVYFHWKVFNDHNSQLVLQDLKQQLQKDGFSIGLKESASNSIQIEGRVFAQSIQISKATSFGVMGSSNSANWSFWEANLSVTGSCDSITTIDEHWIIEARGSSKYNSSKSLKAQLVREIAKRLTQTCYSNSIQFD